MGKIGTGANPNLKGIFPEPNDILRQVWDHIKHIFSQSVIKRASGVENSSILPKTGFPWATKGHIITNMEAKNMDA